MSVIAREKSATRGVLLACCCSIPLTLPLTGPLTVSAQEVPASSLTTASIATTDTSVNPTKSRSTSAQQAPNSKQGLSFQMNEEGVQLVFQGRREEGLAKIKRSLEIDPKNSTALYNLSGLYLADGKPQEAIATINQALALDPKDLSFINRAAEASFANSDIPKAIEHYEHLTKMEPKYEQAMLRLGTLYAMTKNWEGAEKTLRSALSYNKNDTRVMNHLGTVLVMRAKYDEALPLLKRAHQETPSADTAMSLGIAYEGMKRPADAVKSYEEARALGNTDADLPKRIEHMKGATAAAGTNPTNPSK